MLRATGRVAEAESLNPSYQQALEQARRREDSDTEEAAVLSAEDERVASAVLLAELLVPLLAERLGPRPASSATAPAIDSRASAVGEEERLATHPATTVSVPPRPADGGVPGIADLIDGMLAQESPRSARPVRR